MNETSNKILKYEMQLGPFPLPTWGTCRVVGPPAKISKILALRRRLTLLPGPADPQVPSPHSVRIPPTNAAPSPLRTIGAFVCFACFFLSVPLPLISLCAYFRTDARSKPACFVLKLVCNIFVK